jgi:uncharacterized protein (DUF2237 family)
MDGSGGNSCGKKLSGSAQQDEVSKRKPVFALCASCWRKKSAAGVAPHLRHRKTQEISYVAGGVHEDLRLARSWER